MEEEEAAQQDQRRRSHGEAGPAGGTRGAEFYAQTPDGTKFSAGAFSDLHLSRPLLKACAALGYTNPTPIQVRTICEHFRFMVCIYSTSVHLYLRCRMGCCGLAFLSFKNGLLHEMGPLGHCDVHVWCRQMMRQAIPLRQLHSRDRHTFVQD